MRIGKFELKTDAGRFEKVSRRLSVNSACILIVSWIFFSLLLCAWCGGGVKLIFRLCVM